MLKWKTSSKTGSPSRGDNTFILGIEQSGTRLCARHLQKTTAHGSKVVLSTLILGLLSLLFSGCKKEESVG